MSESKPGVGAAPPSPQEGPAGETLARETRRGERPPWAHPNFEPGNKAAIQHGAYSGEVVEQTAEEVWASIEAELQLLPGYLSVDRILIEELREIVSQLVLLRRHRAERGLLDAKGDPRSTWLLEDKLSRRLLDYSKALGLGTAERAKVFGQFMAAGRAHAEALAAQERIRAKLAKPKVNKPHGEKRPRANSGRTRKGQ